MARFRLSIRTRLTLVMAAFVVILVGLAALATTRLISIDAKMEAVSGKSFAATQMLDELDTRIAEFRMAETFRALATDPKQLAAAELLAQQDRRRIEYLLGDYLAVTGKSEAQIGPFRASWNAYVAEHDAWVTADPAGMLDEPARFGSSLHRLYKSTMVAVDRLIYANRAEAKRQAQAANDLVDQTT